MRTRTYKTVRDYPVTRDADGKPLCRWCRGLVKPPRRTMCSAECVHEMELRTNVNYLRSQILKRDKGVCALCGFDTEMMGRVLVHASRAYMKANDLPPIGTWYTFSRAAAVLLKSLDWRTAKTNWEADHIQPVSEGGDSNLENMRTLCVPCHKQVTREMHKRQKEARKAAPSLFMPEDTLCRSGAEAQ